MALEKFLNACKPSWLALNLAILPGLTQEFLKWPHLPFYMRSKIVSGHSPKGMVRGAAVCVEQNIMNSVPGIQQPEEKNETYHQQDNDPLGDSARFSKGSARRVAGEPSIEQRNRHQRA